MKMPEREKARTLRKCGKSINQIVQETGFSKASISVWVRDIVLTPEQQKRISLRGRSIESIEKRRTSRLLNEQRKRQMVIDQAKLDIRHISRDDLKIIGAILYLGEGSKTKRGSAKLSNSDPAVIMIIMEFFRKVCLVPEEKFRIHIHTFSNANVEKTEAYWSKITGVPRDQFVKTYVKQGSASLGKRKTIPFGTCEVSVHDTKLFLNIMGWIEKIKELILRKESFHITVASRPTLK